MTTNDELEARMREAIAARPIEPSAELWERIITSPRPSTSHRRPIWIVITAAGIAALLLLLPEGPRRGRAAGAPALTLDKPTDASPFGPAMLMAQSPAFPLVRGEGPRGLRLRAGTWTYLTIRGEHDTIPTRSRYVIHRGEVNGTAAWTLVSGTVEDKTSKPWSGAWKRYDSLWVSADSLRPMLRISAPNGLRLEQTFQRDQVLNGRYNQNGYVEWFTTILTDTTRFNEASLIRWQDVRTFFQTTTITDDWKRSVPVSQAAEFGSIRPTWLNLSVDGEERLSTPAGVFDCWRIRLGVRLDPPAGVLLMKTPIVEEPGIFFYVSKENGWLVQQTYRGDERQPSNRIVLVDATSD
jgi:hypothetical protein